MAINRARSKGLPAPRRPGNPTPGRPVAKPVPNRTARRGGTQMKRKV